MRVLVCGGRDFEDEGLMGRILDTIPISTVIHGMARGADRMGGAYAKLHGLDVVEFPALWDTHGKRAGHVRNAQMLTEGQPDLVVAFPGGRGTDNMIEQAKKAGVEVKVVNI